jgi:hypothetical protein
VPRVRQLSGPIVHHPTTQAQRPGPRGTTIATGATWPGSLERIRHQCKTFLETTLCPFSLMITNSWSSTRTIGSGGTFRGRDTPFSLQLVNVHTTALFVTTNVPPHCAARRRWPEVSYMLFSAEKLPSERMFDLNEASSFVLIERVPCHSPTSFRRRLSSSESRCDWLRVAQAVIINAVDNTAIVKIEVRIRFTN